MGGPNEKINWQITDRELVWNMGWSSNALTTVFHSAIQVKLIKT